MLLYILCYNLCHIPETPTLSLFFKILIKDATFKIWQYSECLKAWFMKLWSMYGTEFLRDKALKIFSMKSRCWRHHTRLQMGKNLYIYKICIHGISRKYPAHISVWICNVRLSISINILQKIVYIYIYNLYSWN